MIKKNLLILIPARAGSKSIKNKNLLIYKNKKLIVHSFLASRIIKEKSKEIYCTTNSKKIKKIALKEGIKANPLRPSIFCKDLSRDIEFVNHALKVFFNLNITFKNGLILRPTNPNRSKKNINLAYKKFLRSKDATSLKSIYPCNKTPFKTWTLNNNYLKLIAPIKSINESFNAPRQSLPKAFYQTGTYEFFRINYKNNIKTISGKNITYFKVSFNEALDIDNKKDLV